MIEEDLANLVDRFNRHEAKNPGVGEELAGLDRTISIRLTDGESYSGDLAEGRLQHLRRGVDRRPHLTVTTDTATVYGLVRRELGPMKAIVTRKLSIDGSLEDKLLFRKLL